MIEPFAAMISLHRRFADAIFDGRKTVELRSRKSRLAPGSLLLIYVTSPVSRLEGWAVVDSVTSADPGAIWRKFGPRTALTKLEFDAYAAGRDSMSAIGIARAARFEKARSLDNLRRRSEGFHPPQFMAFLDADRFRSLSGFAPMALQRELFAAAE